jgi:hypothetical protein
VIPHWLEIAGAGFVGAITNEAIRAARRSDWLFWLAIRSDVRAIAKAKRKNRR